MDGTDSDAQKKKYDGCSAAVADADNPGSIARESGHSHSSPRRPFVFDADAPVFNPKVGPTTTNSSVIVKFNQEDTGNSDGSTSSRLESSYIHWYDDPEVVKNGRQWTVGDDIVKAYREMSKKETEKAVAEARALEEATATATDEDDEWG
ncbi:hypothetical protein AAVH_00069 [Aphelenchoides avenae]|nr:hypothetical protein AAVH_00069 [Aphelenchus avenae]